MNMVVINDKHIRVKEYKGQRVVSMWDIAAVHSIASKVVRENFENNKGHMTLGKHYFIADKSESFAYDLIVSGELNQNQMNALKDIPLFTEKGYLMIVKPLQGDLAWKVQEDMIDNYFTIKDALSGLSPQLQLLINMELNQKRMDAELQEARQQVAATRQEIQGVRDVVAVKPDTNWRRDTNILINRICKKLEDYKQPKDYLYKALEERAKCDLRRRLENYRIRALANGASKSKVDAYNYLDIIDEDVRLREIYIAIVKEMAIKNGIEA